MPLANVQQVVAPDFTGVGYLMRGANDSFNNAFDSANNILAQYQSGQQTKADGAFIDVIKNAADEKSLTAALAGVDFSKAGLSPEMQKVALGLRDQVLGYDTTRIGNRNSIDMNARANAGENRTQTDWVYGNTARDALNASTPGFINGYVGALTVGQAAPGGPPQSDKAVYYTSELVRRGVPPAVASGVVMNGIDESGLNPAAVGDNGNAGGIFQWNGPRFQGLQAFARDQGKDWKDEQVQLDYFMAENQGSQKDAWSKVVNSQTPQEAAVNFVNHWERPAEQYRASRAAKYAGADGGATPGPNGYTGGQTNGYYQNPAMLAGLDAIKGLAASGTLSPEAAKSLIDTLSGAAQEGQNQINSRDTADQALRAAAAQNQIALDPTIINDTQRQAAMLTAPGLNPLTAQKGAGDLNTLSAPGGALGAISSPPTIADPTVQAAVDQQNAADQLALSTSGEARKQDLLTKFTKAEDPVGALVTQANETGGGSIFAGVTLDEDTRKAVQTLADAAGVSVPQMAATLADMTDPSTEQRGWGLNSRPSLDALLGSVQDGGLGSLRQFFNDPTGNSPSGKDAIIARAKEDAALAAGYTGKSTANLKSSADREATKTKVETTQSQIAKLAAINPSDPQIAILQKQLQDLKQGLFNNNTPTQDAIARVKMYTPGSPDHTREVAALSAAIDADPGIKDKAGAKKALGITP
jgi:hypothetical protein